MSEVHDAFIFEPFWKIDSILTQSEIPNTGSSKNSKKKMFGRSFESNGSLFQEAGENGKDMALTPTSLTSTKGDSTEEPAPFPRINRRAKKSMDNVRPSDRLSLFGNAFSGPLGKSRKPPPRYSAGCVFVESRTMICTDGHKPNRSTDREDDGAPGKDKSGSTFSRLYHMGERKYSISKHSAGELNARQVALDTAAKLAKEEKDRPFLRKRDSGGGGPNSQVPAPPSNGSGLVQGCSVLEQIGTPDFNGWLMKKGEHYSTWKTRYCVLKGHNLYWMRSNSVAVRSHFSCLSTWAETNFNFRRPRSKDTSTLLATRSPPTKISSPEALVSKWNIRTTRPICSIRTPSPSSGNG